MNLMLSISFIIMLTLAKGHIKNKRKSIRGLVAWFLKKVIHNYKK